MSDQDELQAVLAKACTDHFPYVCTGQKTQWHDGSVSCECGDRITTPTPKERDDG